MYPFPTYVLDHAFDLTADRLFEIVETFVRPLSVKQMKALGPGEWHIGFIGANWDEKPERIVIDGVMFIPFNQESRPSEQGTQRHSEFSDKEKLSLVFDHLPSRSIQLVELEITVVNDQRLAARIEVTPGTDGEQCGVGLAGHIVKATGGDAAYQEWLEWIGPRIEPARTDKEVSNEAPAREAGRELGPQGGTMERVKEARALIEDGMGKTKACKKARIDPRTYDRYVAEIIDWEEPLTNL